MQHVKVQVEYGLYIVLAVAFVLIPLPLLLSWCCAVVVHEVGHFAALRILRIPVMSLSLSTRGIIMETGTMLPYEELFCAAAGPLCSALLLLTARFLPIIAICGAVQGTFNLLPILPLDGGRMIRALANIFQQGWRKHR